MGANLISFFKYQRSNFKGKQQINGLVKSVFSLAILTGVFLSTAATANAVTPLAELPVKLVNNRIVISVPVAHYTLNLVLDTGATKTALFQSIDNDFTDLPRAGRANIVFPALDEMVEGDRLASQPLKFGVYTYRPPSILLIRKRPPIGDRLNFRFDGVLGQDFLTAHIVAFDSKRQTIRIYAPEANLESEYVTDMPLFLKGTSPHVRFRHKLPWERNGSVKELLLDTGFPGIMVIWNKRHFALAVGPRNVPQYQQENKGIVTRATFRINKVRFMGAPIFVAPKSPQQAQERDGLLGANVLTQFDFAIDFSRKKLFLGGARVEYGSADGEFYVPNNETVEFKKFEAKKDYKLVLKEGGVDE